MAHEWDIKSRGDRCSVTGREFADGEFFYTALYRDKHGFRREDLSEEAWNQRNDNIQPFSFWRSKFEPPAPPPPEALGKETAEDLLRRYMEDDDPNHTSARYLLAVMLERKRILKQTAQTDSEDGGRSLIYEHAKTGEVFVVPDPELQLEQLASVQQQLADLLRA
jgi:hypothetical protein